MGVLGDLFFQKLLIGFKMEFKKKILGEISSNQFLPKKKKSYLTFFNLCKFL
jgi:hypothetical protein